MIILAFHIPQMQYVQSLQKLSVNKIESHMLRFFSFSQIHEAGALNSLSPFPPCNHHYCQVPFSSPVPVQNKSLRVIKKILPCPGATIQIDSRLYFGKVKFLNLIQPVEARFSLLPSYSLSRINNLAGHFHGNVTVWGRQIPRPAWENMRLCRLLYHIWYSINRSKHLSANLTEILPIPAL